jgi:hypothetical protein
VGSVEQSLDRKASPLAAARKEKRLTRGFVKFYGFSGKITLENHGFRGEMDAGLLYEV